jgi:hypothetical protein
MAAGSGLKFSQALTAGNVATLNGSYYTVPTGYYGVYNISFTNTSSAAQTIRLYIGTSTNAAPNPGECFEYLTTIVPYGVFERTGIVVDAGKNFIVGSSGGAGGVGTSTGAVNLNIYGIETSTS